MIQIDKLRQKIKSLSTRIEELTIQREEYLSVIHNIEIEITHHVGAISVLDSLIKETENETI